MAELLVSNFEVALLKRRQSLPFSGLSVDVVCRSVHTTLRIQIQQRKQLIPKVSDIAFINTAFGYKGLNSKIFYPLR